MTTDMDQLQHGLKESRDVPTDLEFAHYLYEVFLNDRIENEILRMMECYGDYPQIAFPFDQFTL